MLKPIFQSKTNNRRLGLSNRILTLLLALLITITLTLTTQADIDQLLLSTETFKDLGSLAVKLQDARAVVSTSIAMQLSTDTQRLLREYDGLSSPSIELQKALLVDLNRLLRAESLYDTKSFAGIQLSEQTQALIGQNPQSGEALVRLNRSLLADVYPHELASVSEQQSLKPLKGIEVCRENLRQIKVALENYRTSNANTNPQWLSELSPQYLPKKVLLCPADVTTGNPGVLTQEARDPTLPCSYRYEFRHPEKIGQEILWMHEGDMLPIVRCEHHLLNLSVGGKLYRNGPQRTIYNSNKTGFSALADFMQDLRAQLGEEFLEVQENREKIKRKTENLIVKQLIPRILIELNREIHSQLEKQGGKGFLKTQMGADLRKQVLEQLLGILEEKVHMFLQSQIGEEFFKTQEGEDIHRQISVLLSP